MSFMVYSFFPFIKLRRVSRREKRPALSSEGAEEADSNECPLSKPVSLSLQSGASVQKGTLSLYLFSFTHLEVRSHA